MIHTVSKKQYMLFSYATEYTAYDKCLSGKTCDFCGFC